MFAKRLRFLALFMSLMVVAVWSCGKQSGKENAQPSSGSSNLNLKIKSSGLTLTSLGTEGCSCGTPGQGGGGPLCDGGGDGKCYSPTAVKGFFNGFTISNTSGRNAMLLGGGDKYHGLESVFRTAYFDLSKDVFIDGDDNTQDQTGSSYTIATLKAQAIEYQFASLGQYFNVRVPAVTLPVTADPKFVGCIDDAVLGNSKKYVGLYPGMTAATAGDILVCMKPNKTDTCTDAEFKWVNASSGALETTRPSSPVRFSGSAFGSASRCQAGSDHPDATWGELDILVNLASSFDVTAVFEGGKKIYTVSGSKGSTLDLTVNLDASNQIFVPNAFVTEYTTTSANPTYQTTILKNLDKITLRPLYDHNARASTSVNIDKANWFQGVISATVSEKSEAEDGDVEDLSETIPK